MKLVKKELSKKQYINSYLRNFEDGDINYVAFCLVSEIEERKGEIENEADKKFVLTLIENAIAILNSAKRRKLFKTSINEKTAQYCKTLKNFKKALAA